MNFGIKWPCWLALGTMVVGGYIASLAVADQTRAVGQPIRIVNPKVLGRDDVAAVRIPLGIANDYKPWIAQLKNGELLIVAFCFGGTPSNKLAPGVAYLERAVFWRSRDGGKTWEPR